MIDGQQIKTDVRYNMTQRQSISSQYFVRPNYTIVYIISKQKQMISSVYEIYLNIKIIK